MPFIFHKISSTLYLQSVKGLTKSNNEIVLGGGAIGHKGASAPSFPRFFRTEQCLLKKFTEIFLF